MIMILYVFSNWLTLAGVGIVLHHYWQKGLKKLRNQHCSDTDLLISNDLLIMAFLSSIVRLYWNLSPPAAWETEPLFIEVIVILDLILTPLLWGLAALLATDFLWQKTCSWLSAHGVCEFRNTVTTTGSTITTSVHSSPASSTNTSLFGMGGNDGSIRMSSNAHSNSINYHADGSMFNSGNGISMRNMHSSQFSSRDQMSSVVGSGSDVVTGLPSPTHSNRSEVAVETEKVQANLQQYTKWPVLTAATLLLSALLCQILPSLWQYGAFPCVTYAVVVNLLLDGAAMLPQLALIQSASKSGIYSKAPKTRQSSNFVGLLCVGRALRLVFWVIVCFEAYTEFETLHNLITFLLPLPTHDRDV